MSIKNNRITFTVIFALAIILMSTAFITISNSVLKTSLNDSVIIPWNISLGNVQKIDNPGYYDVNINETRMNINFNIDNAGAHYTYLVDAVNNSKYTAKVNNIDIERIPIGTSDKTGYSSYLDDYIKLTITNADTNTNIVRGTILPAYSVNKYRVDIYIKDNLSSDEIYVLGSDKNTKNKLISINLDFQQA
jgi:hypothetical protein